MKEYELIKLLREKNPRGMDELLRDYGPLMKYIVKPILSDERDCEECISEIAMRIWDNIDKYELGKGKWTSWISTISRNVALNYSRKNKYQEQYEELSENSATTVISPEEYLLQTERQKEVRKALGRLERQEQLIFYRKYYYRQTTAQIAKEMGMTERSIEGRIYRAKEKLRKWLGGDSFE